MPGLSDYSGRFQAVIFDFDGTLAELTIDFDLMKRRIGELAADYLLKPPSLPEIPALEWIDVLAREMSVLDGDGHQKFAAQAARLVLDMEIRAAGKAVLYPHTKGVLRDLAMRGLCLGIITRNCRAAVEAVFPDAGDFCRCVLAREDVPRVKPDPDHLLKALKALGVSADRALMVGDHPLDILTGKRAGTRTAAVAGGKVGIGELARAGADLTAEDLPALIAELESLSLI